MSKIHFVYETTNLINKKKYIGQHFGYLDDNYLGSGTLLHKAIRKYGKEHFSRKILQICEDLQDLNNKEESYIKSVDAVNSSLYYNLKEGGASTYTRKPTSNETKKKLSIAASKYKGKLSPLYGVPKSEDHKRNMSKNHADFSGSKHPQYGTKKSEETLSKMRKPRKNKDKMFGPKEKVSCPHCSKVGGLNLMKRYHFNNCKHI